MEKRRTHIVIPEPLVAEIDAVAGKRGRSQFLVQAATFEIKRRRQQAALKQALGAWKSKDHPELKKGVESYLRKLRRESDDRFKRMTGRPQHGVVRPAVTASSGI